MTADLVLSMRKARRGELGMKTLVSLEEFEHLPDNGVRHELNRGELVELPPANVGHILLRQKIARTLEGYAEPKGDVFIYLSAGGQAVWVVYPKLLRVHVHRAGGTITALSGDQQLTAEGILPGLSIPVASLFV